MRRCTGVSGSYGRGGHLPPTRGSGGPPLGKSKLGGAEKCIQCILSEQGKHFSLPTLQTQCFTLIHLIPKWPQFTLETFSHEIFGQYREPREIM